MNRVLLVTILMVASTCALAQIQNANWFLGHGVDNGRILKWYGNIPTVDDSTQIGTKETSSIISDNDGNLLFYTNGCKVYNRLHQPILNGANIPCLVACCLTPIANAEAVASGSQQTNGAIIINDPSDTNRYYLFATDTWTASGPGEVFYYNVVDMTLDGGLGGFIAPFNRTLDSVIYDAVGKVTAIRHANGRDWWILNTMTDILLADPNQPASAYVNGYYIKRYLVSPNGITDSASQFYCSSANDGNASEGEIAVSKQGDKIALSYFKSIRVLDFDRCTGVTSNCSVVDTLAVVDLLTNKFFWQVEFSPNGNVLYAATGRQLYQYDLTSVNPMSSRYLLFQHDMISSDIYEPGSGIMGQLQLGLDDKLYTSVTKLQYWNNNPADTPFLWLRRIEFPDSLGVGCQLNNHALYLGVMALGLPNLANFSLGPLVGSVCDTLHTSTTALRDEEKFTAQLFPNPATTEATLVLSKPAPYDIQLLLYDVVGKEVLSKQVPRHQKYIQLDLQSLSEGVYSYRLGENRNSIMQGKLVKFTHP